ncbi:unnamed protein product [Moneuplotes crassus]|uniref:Uncharacterized protein n=1 Tax=Euplotes crassus TaxID=5936 RepID=A0AAD1XSW0_EUPCR|nr:unnamed protein product [Moneuplotes crassus]
MELILLSREEGSKSRKAKLRRSINLSTTKNLGLNKMFKMKKKNRESSNKAISKMGIHQELFQRYGWTASSCKIARLNRSKRCKKLMPQNISVKTPNGFKNTIEYSTNRAENCLMCLHKDKQIRSMAIEIEELTQSFSQLITNSIEDQNTVAILNEAIKQTEIKCDLETSFLQTKVTLLEEALNSKNKDLETLDAFKENNSHLLALLDKYDQKMVDMQNDIDIRDLKIDHLVSLYEKEDKEADFNLLESKIRFLLELLDYCKQKLEDETNRKIDNLSGGFNDSSSEVLYNESMSHTNPKSEPDFASVRVDSYFV